jgi:hypothetical protein
MSECPSVDALTTIAGALEWNTDAGLRHLATCPNCIEQMRLLQVTHEAFEFREDVGDDVVAKITHLMSTEAAQEGVREQRRNRIGNLIEALLAGLTGVAVVGGGGVNMPGAATVGVFGTVAVIVLAYRAFASSETSPHSIPP